MVTLNRIYTKTGDTGETGLGDGSRVAKTAPRVAVIGAIDEANAAIGIARLDADAALDAILATIQHDLFDLGADICLPEGADISDRPPLRMSETQTARLEREIDAVNGELPPLSSFVLPGGSVTAARLHLARTIVRRAERELAELAAQESVNPAALTYLNRLSDHLFVNARRANANGSRDVLWQPGQGR